MQAQNRLYMDNAATSFPKPDTVHQAMLHFATTLGASPGRGSYQESVHAGELLNITRERITQLINSQNPNHVIFTLNCSDALNLAIKGALRPGDHIITTELDHNSILRPLNALEARNQITQTRVPCDPQTGHVDINDIRNAIQPNTRMIATLHGSNVTGTLQDITAIGTIAREHDLLFLVDAAQSLGHVPVDVQTMNIDLLAAPGHKGLMGPLGTGFLYIRPDVEKQLRTIREGGTGSVSELDVQPDFMPDRFEPGSHNTIGLIGLSEGVNYILKQSIEQLWQHDQQLTQTFLDTISQQDTPGFTLYGPPTLQNRCSVFSIRIEGYDDPVDLSAALENNFGILTRSGLHCAPGAHATIGTDKLGGTTRLSFGAFTSTEDAVFAANAIAQLARKQVVARV